MHAQLTALLAGACLVVACHYTRTSTGTSDDVLVATRIAFAAGGKAGDECEVAGIRLCWCPAGTFRMGSPPDEPYRSSDEAQVDVTLSGFWMGKYEVTQGEWKRVMGVIPGKLIAGEGDDFPVYWINFIEAEEFCRRSTERARAANELPQTWEFRVPTEAQWEYACRAGTTTAFAFGDTMTDRQANIGKPYNGKPDGTPGTAASKVGSYPANAWPRGTPQNRPVGVTSNPASCVSRTTVV